MPNSIIPSLTKSKKHQQIDGYINKNKYDIREVYQALTVFYENYVYFYEYGDYSCYFL